MFVELRSAAKEYLMPGEIRSVIWFEELTRENVALVGGKNASLGEMIRALSPEGIRVPPGFATTADAFRDYLAANRLNEAIAETLARLDAGKLTLHEAGAAIRADMVGGDWPDDIAAAILDAYRELARRTGRGEPAVAVRSSATAEDLPDASFAGQQETFLNIRGERRCSMPAGAATPRSSPTARSAIARRRGSIMCKVALSVGVQQMVRADLGGAGVMFSIDTETGFDKVVLINAAWGLGENVVQGAVDPDEYEVFKPLLSEPGLRPIIEKRLGAKERKMVYAGAGGTDAQRARRPRPSVPPSCSPTTRSSRSPARRSPSSGTTASRWTWNGRRMARPARSSSCRRGRRPCSPASRRGH